MNDPLLVGFLQRLGDLFGDFESFVHWNRTASDTFREGRAFDQL